MDVRDLGKRIISLALGLCFIVSGCMPSDIPSRGTRDISNSSGGGALGLGDSGSAPTTTIFGNGTSLPPKVEIRHLIEPNLSTDLTYSSGTGFSGGGSYVRKLTLPKNFQGRLYVAGINIVSLADRHVRVRFKFGMNREPVTIPATVVAAPGITPFTAINVLVLDMRSEPFRNVRLPYDLYDYNDYDFSAGDEPTQDNRNTNLYCRGLKIEDDPTFVGVGACDGTESNPDQPAEECLYAYAKVLDQGLVQDLNGQEVPLLPSLPQSKSVTGGDFYMDFMSSTLKKPLLDTLPTSAAHTLGPYTFSLLANPVNSSDSINITFSGATAFNPVTINGINYSFRGPYRLVNQSQWQFAFSDLDGEKKLFKEDSYILKSATEKIYYNSYLFPLATKLEFAPDVSHLSSETVDGVRTENILSVAGETKWMDGSNARAISRNSELEHIGSCNVSSSIEIVARDNNGNDYVVATANDVKLQLVRSIQHRTDINDDVLYTNFKRCESNAGCAGNECCFNNRCWDETLVTQCFDSSAIQGNRNIGDSCSTDLDCSSLCCNRTSGQCAAHNSLLDPAVLCSKPVGDFCIAQEWCQKSPVTRCYIIRTGTDPLGNTTCRQHCYTTQEFGDCKNGICVPPEQDIIPTFDANNPDCTNAITAPSF